jgi:hypothetical protein
MVRGFARGLQICSIFAVAYQQIIWIKSWDVELVTMTFDTLELRVGHPPQDRETALKLAQEQ